jgi:hypothetical protein
MGQQRGDILVLIPAGMCVQGAVTRHAGGLPTMNS